MDFQLIESAFSSLYNAKAREGNMNGYDENDIKKLFHYTTTNVLNIILDSASFWASNMLYLNDADEYKNGIKMIRDCCGCIDKNEDAYKYLKNERQKDFWANIDEPDDGEIYTISFCQDGDLLSQWITYAKESGVALELDEILLDGTLDLSRSENFYFIVKSDSGNDQSDGDKKEKACKIEVQAYSTANVLSNIIYRNEIDDTFKKYMSDFICAINNFDSPINEADKRCMYKIKASYIKNPKFEAEKEVRASFMNVVPNKSSAKKSKINYFRTDKGVLRPYLEVQIALANNNLEFKPCLPLKSITVGPSGVQQAVFDSVIHRLKNGERKIYNYAKKNPQKFTQNFSDYLEEVLEYAKENNLFNYKGEIEVEGRYNFAENEMELDIKRKKREVNKSVKDFIFQLVNRLNKHVQEIVDIKINGIDNTTDFSKVTKYDDAIREIRKNFYFTEEGVLIRKSKIPYIF